MPPSTHLHRWCVLMIFLLLSGFALIAPRVGSKAQSAQTRHDFETQKHIGPPEEALVGITVINHSAEGTAQTRHGNGVFLRCDGFVLAPEALFRVQNTPGDKVAGKPNQKVIVVLHPGTNHEEPILAQRPDSYVRLDSGDRYYQMTYAVLKVNDIHVPAPHALLPDALSPGMPLKVFWSEWSESQSRFLPVQSLDSAVGKRAADPDLSHTFGAIAAQNNQNSAALQGVLPQSTAPGKSGDAQPAKPEPSIALFVRQTTVFAHPLSAMLRGAIVVGPENMLVGMVTEAADTGPSHFANFDSLDKTTNCIAALPSTDAQYAEFQKRLERGEDPTADPNAKPKPDTAKPAGTTPAQNGGQAASPDKGAATPPDGNQAAPPLSLRAQSDMVSIPGGPLTLPTLLEDYQPDMQGQSIACIPPFQIDRYEVTNAQYLEFWNSLPDKQRKDAQVQANLYPYGWGEASAPFPAEMANMPVLGVRLAGAKAYAKWAGKRLPTPYEWCLAAFGPEGGNKPPEWARKYIQARREAWQKIVEAHIAYAHQHPEIVPGFWADRTFTGISLGTVEPDWSKPVMEEFLQLPWFFFRPDYAAAAVWSKQCVKQFTDPLFQEWIDPIYVLPVGSRPYDVSPYGVADMLMNARELVLPGPQTQWHNYPTPNWPYKEVDRYMEVDWAVGNSVKAFAQGPGAYGIGDATKLLESAVPDNNGYFLTNLDIYVQPGAFVPTNLLIAHPDHIFSGSKDPNKATAEHMAPGLAFTNFPLPLTSLVAPNQAEFDGKLLGLDHMTYTYTFRMPSRRIRSAAQNARAGDNGFVPADLGDYVKVCAAVQEYTELLRPVDGLTLNLVAGPTFETPYWASSGTFGFQGAFDPGIPKQQYQSRRSVVRTNGATSRNFEEAFGLASTGHRFYWYADATQISKTGAYSAWANGPEHFHYELGHPLAVDDLYPINARNLNVSTGATSYAPDTFVIPGGFRCAR